MSPSRRSASENTMRRQLTRRIRRQNDRRHSRVLLERLEERLALSTTVTGTIAYPNPLVGSLPLQGAVVEASFVNPLTATTTTVPVRTDQDGNYSLDLTQWYNIGVTSVNVAVRLEGPHDPNHPPVFRMYLDTNSVNESEIVIPVAEIPLAATPASPVDYTAPSRSWEQRAFARFNYLSKAAEYADYIGAGLPGDPGFPVSTLTVLSDNKAPWFIQWYSPAVNAYAKWWNELDLNAPDDQMSSDLLTQNFFTPMHEFGHFIAQNHGFDLNPGDVHSFQINQRGYASQVEPRQEDLAVSWSEGFANFFSIRSSVITGVLSAYANSDRFNIEIASPNSYTRAAEGDVGLGEDSEISVARILWDLVDSGPGDDDNVAMTDGDLFDILATAAPPFGPHARIVTLSDLWSVLLARAYTANPQQSPAELLAKRLEYANIFSRNGVGAVATGAGDGADPAKHQFRFDVPVARKLNESGSDTDPGDAFAPTMNKFNVHLYYKGERVWNSGSFGLTDPVSLSWKICHRQTLPTTRRYQLHII